MLRGAGTARAQLLDQFHPGYVAGIYYSSPYLTSVRTTDVQVADSLRAIPFRVFRTVTVDRLAIRVASGVAGNAKCGIYRAGTAAGQFPDALVAEVNADIPTGVAGDFEAAFASNPTLTPALYWCATCCSAAAILNSVSASSQNGLEDEWGAAIANGVLSNVAAQKTTGFVRTAALPYVAGAPFFPANFGAGTLLANNPGAVNVAMRAA